MYSNPPIHGARIVREILSNKELKAEWLQEVKGIADRIIGVRNQLRANLKKLGSTKPWNHITDQVGFFCYSGLTLEQVDTICKSISILILKISNSPLFCSATVS